MSLHEKICKALTKYLAEDEYLSYLVVDEGLHVAAYQEVERNDGYCETCVYEYTALELTLAGESGRVVQTYDLTEFDLAEFLRSV